MEKPYPFCPGIYYLHPLLAGALREWGTHLDRCAELGFDHVLVAPIFATGHVSDIFLTGDASRPHPALGWHGDALSAIGQAAEQCRARGLRLLMDLVIDRAAADSLAVAAHPGLFGDADGLAALDPRAADGDFGAVRARWDRAEAAAGLVELFAGQLRDWAAAGVAGVRIESLRAVPPAGLRALIDAVRRAVPDFLFLGWTPGLARTALAGLRGAGLDFVVSSLPWWDFRAGWLWDEAASLRAVAPVLAAPEAPFGPRLAAGWRDPASLRAAWLRALGCAAALESGWLMPMGFEDAARRPLARGYGRAEGLAAARAAAPSGLSAAIVAANARRAQRGGCLGAGDTRLLSGPGADVIALLRAEAADLRQGGPAALVLANVDLAMPHDVHAAALLPGAGATFGGFEDDTTRLLPGEVLRLGPAEVRILQAVPATVVQRRIPPAGPAARAAATAPRVAIEDVSPSVADGPFAVRRLLGETVTVEADLICDGHDLLAAMLLWRAADESAWNEVPMRLLGNDRWQAAFPLRRLGRHEFAIEAWRDVFATFRDELAKKHAAGLSLAVEIEEGRQLVLHAQRRSAEPLRAALATLTDSLETGDATSRRLALLAEPTAALMRAADERPFRSRTDPFPVEAERTAAGCASWYELFPRSMSDDPARHGTFADVIRHLPRIRDMGFDVLYFPPIHPIGRTNRKGRNNALQRRRRANRAAPMRSARRRAGTTRSIPNSARSRISAACAMPPWRTGWSWRSISPSSARPIIRGLPAIPTGSTGGPTDRCATAENPPKKYEDIVNVDFYAPARCRACGWRCATWCCSGWAKACASSGWTTRTPSRCRSGSG